MVNSSIEYSGLLITRTLHRHKHQLRDFFNRHRRLHSEPRCPSRSLITLYPDTRREHHLAAPHACEPPSGQFHQRVPRPPLRRPRARFLPRSTRPHSPNPHLRWRTIPVNLPIARPTSLSASGANASVSTLWLFPRTRVLSAVGVRKFPHEFFREAYRLLGWEYKTGQTKHSPYMGKFINKYVFEALPPGSVD